MFSQPFILSAADSGGKVTFVKQVVGFIYYGGCLSEEQSHEAVKGELLLSM